jgi:hypothetical protein
MNTSVPGGGVGHRLTVSLFTLLALTLSSFVAAEESHKFSVSLGVFVNDRESTTTVGVQGNRSGTEVDLEKDLDLERSDAVFRLDGYYRFNDVHRIDFSAFDLSRSSNKVLESDIDWAGVDYPAGTTVDSKLDLNIYKLAYTWSFLRRDKGYLGITGGLYIADMDLLIAVENAGEASGGGVTAPLPVIGLRGEYQFSEKWSLRASGEFFALEYDAFDGLLTDLYVGVDYQLFDNASIGVGLNSVHMDVGVGSSSLTGDLDWKYSGGLVFVKFDF